jgi:AraC family transcriptional regulator
MVWHDYRRGKRMKSYKKGEYSGNVTALHDERGVLSSITTYDQNNFNGTWHYHENTHISLVMYGGCLEKKKEGYERLPGMLTFYHAAEPHQVMQVSGRSRHINLEIERKFLAENGLDEHQVGKAVTSNPDGKFLLLKMQHELLSADTVTGISIRMLLLDFICGTEKVKSTPPAWIRRIHDLLEASWSKQVDLESLSAAAGVHPVTVCKYFHRYFGCTLGQYLRKLKTEKALAMISQGGYSLSEITYRCGFADQSHFIRTFKQYTGLLPRKYQGLASG